MKRYTRYIDRVTVKGSVKPIGLYTVDMLVANLPPSKPQSQYLEEGITKQDREEIERLKKKEIGVYLWEPEENEWSAEEFIQ